MAFLADRAVAAAAGVAGLRRGRLSCGRDCIWDVSCEVAPESDIPKLHSCARKSPVQSKWSRFRLLSSNRPRERLRGVDYSVRMPAMEPECGLRAGSGREADPNVNVRLAAIDALSKVSGDRRRTALADAARCDQQDSPMVQAALIDYVVDARDRQALGTLKQLANRSRCNPLVRQRADRAVRQLTEYK